MKRWQWSIFAATFFIWGNAAKAQERIRFRSLDSSATVLDGYLYPSTAAGRHPAVVFLHGCRGRPNAFVTSRHLESKLLI